MRVKVCVPSTHTKDSGLWSRDMVWPSFRLRQWVKELRLDVVSGNMTQLDTRAPNLRVVQWEDTVVW